MTASLTPPSTLVGRDRELAILRDQLAAARGGQGSLVLIGGEAGIGKTALAEALCREAAEQGVMVLVGRCYDLTETPPYGPWVDLFGRCRRDAGMPAVPPAFTHGGLVGRVTSQTTLFQHVLDFFIALTTDQPLVILLDDLHWADPASLDLLRFLARSLATFAALVLVTYRTEAVADHHPLHTLIPALVREARTERFDLHVLRDDAVRALINARYVLQIADSARLGAYVQRRTDGNPFFINEILHSLEGDAVLRHTADGWRLGELLSVRIPELVRQVVDLRVRRLGDAAHHLLTVAAVIGQEVPLAVWRTVAAVDDEAVLDTIGRAEAAHLLDVAPDGTRIFFAHALVRETLYEGIMPARRRPLHRHAAEALSTLPDVDVDAVAFHFQQASDERAKTWLLRAGEHAEHAQAWLTAAARYEAALALRPDEIIDVSQRVRLLIRIAWYRRFADPHAASASLEVAERLALTAQNPSLATWAVLTRGKIRCRVGDMRRGLQDLRVGVAAVDTMRAEGRLGNEVLAAADIPFNADGDRGSLALWLAHAGYYGEAAVVVEHLTTRNSAHQRGHISAAMGEQDEARAMFSLAVTAARSDMNNLGFGQVAIDELQYVALPYFTDDLHLRRSLAKEAETAWVLGSGALHPRDSPRLAQLLLLVLEGHWSEARELAHVVSAAPVADNRRLLAARALGQLARHQGDPALGWRLVLEWLPDGPATQPGDVLFLDALELQRLAVALALDACNLTTARRWLRAHDAWLEWSGARMGMAEAHLSWAIYDRAAGDAEQASDHARQALTLASSPRQPLTLVAVNRVLGELDSEAGRPAEAEAHLDIALALADACVAPFERALILFASASLCAKTGDRDAATALLDEARAICIPLGAEPTLARIDALAARLTLTSANTSQYPDALSQREVEVLRLLTQGMSNSAIAVELFVSVRTVERHIRNLYMKIGAHNRADATAYAFRHDLT